MADFICKPPTLFALKRRFRRIQILFLMVGVPPALVKGPFRKSPLRPRLAQ